MPEKPNPPGETPLGMAIVLCDEIIIDQETQKKSLIGTFCNLWAPEFPVQHPKLCVYVTLTNGMGMVQVEMKCCNTATAEKVFGIEGQIQFPDPNHVHELIFKVNNLIFPQAGVYSFEVLCNDEMVLENRFNVAQMEKGKL